MDEGRYGLVRRQEDQHRKFVCIINDILKTKTEVYESCLTREKYESSFRYVKNVMTVRRALVRQKVLQKCLEMRRRGADGKKSLYGRYGGAPLHAMNRDVEAYIASKHPKVRRIQKVQKLLREGLENGELLDPDAMNSKVEDFFRRRLEKKESKLNVKEVIPSKKTTRDRGYSLENSSEKVHVWSNEKQVVSPSEVKILDTPKKKLTKDDNQNVSEKCSEEEDVFVLKRRPTLILPPITTNRALVQGIEN